MSSYKRCSNCQNNTPLHHLTSCCVPKQQLCLDCKTFMRCSVCQKYYPSASKNKLSFQSQRCGVCTLIVSNCLCQSKRKEREQRPEEGLEFCKRCRKMALHSNLFKNRCGHTYCERCVREKEDRCECYEVIDAGMKDRFLAVCCGCDRVMGNQKNVSGVEGLVLCGKCGKGNEEMEEKIGEKKKVGEDNNHMDIRWQKREEIRDEQWEPFDLDSLRVEDKQCKIIVEPPASLKQKEREKQIINNDDEKDLKFNEQDYSLSLPVKQKSNQKQKVQQQQQMGNNNQHSSPDKKQQLPKNQSIYSTPIKNIQSPPQSPPLNHPSSSKFRSPKSPSLCSLCNIIFPHARLFPYPSCSNKHKICKTCILVKRKMNVPICPECEIENEEELARKLIYEEIKGKEERAQFVEEWGEGMVMCRECSIILPEEKIFGMRKQCILCVSK